MGPFIGLGLFGLALWVLHHQLARYRYRDVMHELGRIPGDVLLVALVFVLGSYLALTVHDVLAVRYVGRTLPYRKIALASFVGYAFSHNVGFSVMTGAPVRFRLYSGWGLSTLEITKIVGFGTLTFWLGLVSLGGSALLAEPAVSSGTIHLSVFWTRAVGLVLLSAVVLYLAWTWRGRTEFRVRSWEFQVPSLQLSLVQILVSSADWLCAASVLYVLLPESVPLSYPAIVSLFLLAQISGLASQVPGGLGVFETVVVLVLSPYASGATVLGSLIAYRVLYYLVPLGLAVILLGSHEVLERRWHLAWLGELFDRWIAGIVPQILAFTTAVGGALLLFSGATPAVHSRLAWLNDFLPLPVVEASHFLASMTGVGLLLLARGLQQRLDAAYVLASGLLASGIVFSVLKGLDYEEALALSVMLIALLPSRKYFYRRASIFSPRLTPGWIAAVAAVVGTSVWLGLFAYKHVEYSQELWWRFALYGDAPRFLRASVGALLVLAAFAAARLLRPSPPRPASPDPRKLERARAAIEASPDTAANLAFLGDKTLLFSESGRSFVMYAVEGRSWVSMGDPVGPHDEKVDLIWRFRELADMHGGWPMFYEVGGPSLPYYLDLGLSLFKLGEEARVPLESFSLDGRSRKDLRHDARRAEREGSVSFEVVLGEGVASLLPELRRISDGWLRDKRTREKRFSLGCFREDYVARFPVAVVRLDGRIVAFGNVWAGADHEELSLDLMRHSGDAPTGVMDYLIVQLMLWGKHAGYRWFSLGMAPLSGLEDRVLAPLWTRMGALLFRYGEQFYNFQGIRKYKEKFDPVWEPRYLACPGGMALPRMLANLAALISGGLRGTVAK